MENQIKTKGKGEIAIEEIKTSKLIEKIKTRQSILEYNDIYDKIIENIN